MALATASTIQPVGTTSASPGEASRIPSWSSSATIPITPVSATSSPSTSAASTYSARTFPTPGMPVLKLCSAVRPVTSVRRPNPTIST